MISPLSTFSSIVLEVSSCVFSEVPELPAEELSFSPEVPCDLFSFAGVFSEVPDFWGAFVGFGVAVTSVFSTVSEPEPHPVRTLPDITANKKNKAAFFITLSPFT